ncbi:hypothetical protein EDB19DRAFT_1700361 [Suillus lakei]|nr:hypothetical protein EDB19DRAFT_1700361 [Suillus lakei]
MCTARLVVTLSCRQLTFILYAEEHKWAAHSLSDEEDEEDNFTCPDSIEAYLDSPRVSKPEVNAAGGVLQYWENAPQMALDFLSAPGMTTHSQVLVPTTSTDICYIYFIHIFLYLQFYIIYLVHPRVTRITCGSTCGSTHTRDSLTHTGAGRPSECHLPAGWVRVPPGCTHVTP